VSDLTLPDDIKYDSQGLVPVIAQDEASGDILMVAWANAEALRKTMETGIAHFWSRSRQALWRKGETSGNELTVVALRADCDKDTLIAVVRPVGPACHTNERTCFGEGTHTLAGIFSAVERVIAERAQTMPEGSYTARLIAKGLDASLKKLGEEATEVVLAAKGETQERLADEAADLLFHLQVALHQRGVPFSRVAEVLRRRRMAG
jgi:phosphoribosyl-ATP pyrophosphohydrolase/phosphoribosyl-AMP cyclohydrolase